MNGFYDGLLSSNLSLKFQPLDGLQLVSQQLLAEAQTMAVGRSGGIPEILLKLLVARPEGRNEKVRMNGWRRHFLLILLAGLPLVARPNRGQAQSSQAVLLGVVTNEASGVPLAKALVIERNLQTNAQSYRYTNEQGLFYFPAMLPGMYSVRVDAGGFQPEERSPVELPVASQIELNFSLHQSATPAPSAAPSAARIGANLSNPLAVMYGADAAVPQALLVSLPLRITETLIGDISSLIDERKILDLPLSGRDVYTLLVLQPGVSSDNATARGLGFSVNGQRASSSNFLIDGVDNNDLLVTGPATLVSAEAVKEYRMVTNNFTADFGRASGFIANAITRTGTNSFHGTLYEFFNHDRLNANSFASNWQNLPRLPYRQNQYGASLGGPVRRDRLFFFGNFEQLRSSSESPPSNILLPSSQYVASFPAGALAKELLGSFPPPAGQPIAGVPFAVADRFTFPLLQRNTFAMGRMDYNSPGGGQHLGLRYAFSQQTTDDFLFSPYPNLNAPLVVRGQNLAINYIRDLFGGSNELKFGFNRNSVNVLRPNSRFPTLESGDGIVLPGSEAAYNYFFRDTVFDVVDNFSRLIGKHALVAGVEWKSGLHDSLRTHSDESGPRRRGRAGDRIVEQGIRSGRRDDFRKHHHRATGGRQDRNPRLRQLPHAAAPRAHRAESEDRGESGSPSEEDPLFQTQQRAEGLRQPPACGRRRRVRARRPGLKRDGLSVDAVAVSLRLQRIEGRPLHLL